MLSKDNLCMIYHSSLRPTVCRHFPLDQKDLNDVVRWGGSIDCGYAFPRQAEEHVHQELSAQPPCPNAQASLAKTRTQLSLNRLP